MGHLLGAEAVGIAYPNRRVFDAVSLGLQDGDRIGIVGRNGDGKSTLLSLLAGRIAPHSGRVTQRRGLAVGYLTQDDDLPDDATVRQVVLGQAADHTWASDAKLRDVIGGLIGDVALEAPIGQLSGGQRRRTALAKVLAADVEVLFLDEPTNHLDLAGINWLADHLTRRWPVTTGAVAVVTHDRWFLDAVCQTTWEVHDQRVEPFDGGYAAYVLARLERDRQAAAIETRRRNILRKELAWLRRGAPARTSKPKFRLDAASALIGGEPPPRNGVELVRLATARLGKDVVDFHDVVAAYDGGPPVLRDLTWSIGPGDRIGLLGANGAGKSTLLALVTGQLAPVAGRVKRGRSVRVATLSQRSQELDALADQRVSDVIAANKTAYAVGGHDSPRWSNATGWVGAKELSPAQVLERLGFSSAHLATPVGDLSGGQRRRLQLTLVLLAEPNLLILDEPTNDLDTDMLASLEDLLDGWLGTLIVVSHDRYLLERVTDQQYAVIGGQLRHLPGGVEEYLRLVAAPDRAEPTAKPADQQPSLTPTGAELRAVDKELASLERRIKKLQQQAADARLRLADLDQSDYKLLRTELAKITALDDQATTLEERWLELSVLVE